MRFCIPCLAVGVFLPWHIENQGGIVHLSLIHIWGGIVAGPYHPAFGALVESALAFDGMCAALNGLRASKVTVAVNPRFVSILVGNRRENIRRLKARYGFDEICIEQCPDVPYGTFEVVN